MLKYREVHADRLGDRATEPVGPRTSFCPLLPTALHASITSGGAVPTTNTVADYTEPSLVLPLLRSRDAAGVTAELCSVLQRQGRVSDLLPFYHAVISHEALSATVIPPGWALPHARNAGIPQLTFALGRTAEPLPWFGGELVSLVLLLAVPESDGAAYLSLIAGLAKLSRDEVRLERLGEAPDSQTMFEVLQGIPLPRRRATAVNP